MMLPFHKGDRITTAAGGPKSYVGTGGARSACPSGKHDTDNNGTCYTCGKYVADGDAGRFI